MKASEEVLAILRQATIDDEGLTLVGELDRKSYQDVNKFLEAAGAKWNKKAKRHLFTGNSKAEIEGLLGTGKIVHKKNLYQAFYTPESVAKHLVRLAGVRHGDTCLEPSAGHGAIAKEIEAAGGMVYCVDLNPDAVEALEKLHLSAMCKDFLTCEAKYLGGTFDRIVMNPPFQKNQAWQHVLHAQKMLHDGGTLVAILPNSEPTGKALREEWDHIMTCCGEWIEDLPKGTFRESGTNVRTKIVRLTK